MYSLCFCSIYAVLEGLAIFDYSCNAEGLTFGAESSFCVRYRVSSY